MKCECKGKGYIVTGAHFHEKECNCNYIIKTPCYECNALWSKTSKQEWTKKDWIEFYTILKQFKKGFIERHLQNK